jgi:NAD(P)-dependent dehydrogenase (short-subunit alcohol dehydrogenase family)
VRALVTGAAGGIGRALARVLAGDGWDLLITDASPAVEEVAAEVVTSGRQVHAVVADLVEEDSARRLVAAAVERLGGLEGLVNNAAIGPLVPFLETTREHVDEVMDLNFDAPRRLCLAAAPALIASHGAIVNIASTAGILGSGRLTTYAASKGAVIAFTRALAVELARQGVRVNAVAPGLTRTPAIQRLTEPQVAERTTRIPLGHLGDPGDIAYAVSFLLSARAKQITGQVLAVDGGHSIFGVF